MYSRIFCCDGVEEPSIGGPKRGVVELSKCEVETVVGLRLAVAIGQLPGALHQSLWCGQMYWHHEKLISGRARLGLEEVAPHHHPSQGGDALKDEERRRDRATLFGRPATPELSRLWAIAFFDDELEADARVDTHLALLQRHQPSRHSKRRAKHRHFSAFPASVPSARANASSLCPW